MRKYHPHVKVRAYSPNISSRMGAQQTLFVVHATAGHNRPGITDLVGLGGWFGLVASQVSSHTASDNEGNSARYAHERDKAWHCMAYNRMSHGHEQVLPGDGTEVTRKLYNETARWIAWWSLKTGIKIKKAKIDGLTIVRPGIIRHSELGALGGNHADPGQYNLRKVMRKARWYKAQMKRGR